MCSSDLDTDDQESESATGDTVREPESGPRSVLPQSVERGLRAAVPRASVLDAQRRDGLWEATVKVGIRSQRMRLDDAGNLLERELPVSPRELPVAVLDTLDRVHPRSTIWRAARIETNDASFHEVLLARGDRRTAVVLDDEGRILTGRSRT